MEGRRICLCMRFAAGKEDFLPGIQLLAGEDSSNVLVLTPASISQRHEMLEGPGFLGCGAGEYHPWHQWNIINVLFEGVFCIIGSVGFPAGVPGAPDSI